MQKFISPNANMLSRFERIEQRLSLYIGISPTIQLDTQKVKYGK